MYQELVKLIGALGWCSKVDKDSLERKELILLKIKEIVNKELREMNKSKKEEA